MAKKIKRKQFTAAEAKIVGDKLGIDWEQFDIQEFCMGMNIELRDGIYNPITNFASDDPMLAGKSVRTHLNEAPDYYTRLAQTEKEAKLPHDRKRKTTKKSETVNA